MTKNVTRELLARIGTARIADSATLQRLNYKAVATGLAMPYDAFHGLDPSARDLWVVWAVAESDGRLRV
jgi:hypothetical protein